MRSILLVAVAFALVSWGWAGHKTVATIAENHLSVRAKAGVQMLLGDTAMTDVASWADEVLNEPAYRATAPWHYANVPLGLTYGQFSKSLSDPNTVNIYNALQLSLHILKDPDNAPAMRAQALKFIIHLVGDAHQPMHVSRAEDKGGNTIQVQFEGKGTNLHSLWDGKLIGREGLSVPQMAIDYDKASPKEIKQWQGDDMMKWLFESYAISSKLYSEKVDGNYYKEHIAIVQQRVEMAGIRLAGLLNEVFKDLDVKVTYVILAPPPVNSPPVPKAPGAELKDLKGLVGETVTTQGQVYGVKDIGSMVLVNVGAAYPNQLLTVALKGNAKILATSIDNKLISITGTVIDYKGKPEIVVSDSAMVQVVVKLKK
jgi:hypothetical protein